MTSRRIVHPFEKLSCRFSSHLLRLAMLSALIVALPLLAPGQAMAAEEGEGCLSCHSDPDLNEGTVDAARELVLDMDALGKSVHADVECTDCHTQLADADPED